MKEFGLALLGAVLALAGQAITTFIIQKKREDKITEEKGILDAVRFLGDAIHQLQYYAYERDEEKFREVFKKGDHFAVLTSLKFHLKRMKDREILKKFETAYSDLSDLGFYIDSHDSIFDGTDKFQSILTKFSESQKVFEDYCANYLEFGKV